MFKKKVKLQSSDVIKTVYVKNVTITKPQSTPHSTVKN